MADCRQLNLVRPVLTNALEALFLALPHARDLGNVGDVVGWGVTALGFAAPIEKLNLLILNSIRSRIMPIRHAVSVVLGFTLTQLVRILTRCLTLVLVRVEMNWLLRDSIPLAKHPLVDSHKIGLRDVFVFNSTNRVTIQPQE